MQYKEKQIILSEKSSFFRALKSAVNIQKTFWQRIRKSSSYSRGNYNRFLNKLQYILQKNIVKIQIIRD